MGREGRARDVLPDGEFMTPEQVAARLPGVTPRTVRNIALRHCISLK